MLCVVACVCVCVKAGAACVLDESANSWRRLVWWLSFVSLAFAQIHSGVTVDWLYSKASWSNQRSSTVKNRLKTKALRILPVVFLWPFWNIDAAIHIYWPKSLDLTPCLCECLCSELSTRRTCFSAIVAARLCVLSSTVCLVWQPHLFHFHARPAWLFQMLRQSAF